jgi:hypothetical protein
MTSPRDGATPGTTPRVDRKHPQRTRPVRPPRVPIPDGTKVYDVSDAYDHDDPERQTVITDWLLAVGRYAQATTSAAKADADFSTVAADYHEDGIGRDDVLRACASHLATLESVRLAKADVTTTALTITQLIAGKAVADFVRAALIGGAS